MRAMDSMRAMGVMRAIGAMRAMKRSMPILAARRGAGVGALLALLLAFAAPMAAVAQDAYTNRTAHVRAGPDRTYPQVAVFPAGAPLQVVGCLDDWSWCDVTFPDGRGWIYGPSLNYSYQGERVPFYAYAPSFGIPIVTFSLGTYWDQYYRGRPWYSGREQWERRTLPPHVRPPGPAPRASPPPPRARPMGPARPPGPAPRPESGPRNAALPPPAAVRTQPVQPREIRPVRPVAPAPGAAAPQLRPEEGRPGGAAPNRAPPAASPARGEAPANREPPRGAADNGEKEPRGEGRPSENNR